MKEAGEKATNTKLKELTGTYKTVVDSQVRATDQQIKKIEERIGGSIRNLVSNLVSILKEKGLRLPEAIVLGSEISDPKGMFQEETVRLIKYSSHLNQLFQTELTTSKAEGFPSGHSFGVDIPRDEQKETAEKLLGAKDWIEYGPKIINALEELTQTQIFLHQP